MGEMVAWYAVFLFSVTLHEAAHAWTAKLGGDPTAYLGGQVSLDPLPHIRRQPFGMVILPAISLLLTGWPFGFASAPYDPFWAYKHPRRAAWMALAGPGSNLSLVIVSVLLAHTGIALGIFSVPAYIGFAHIVDSNFSGFCSAFAYLLGILFTMNLILAVLNVIPLPPLDGSEIISLFINEERARAYQEIIKNPAFGFLGLFLAWQVFDPLFEVIFLIVINLIYPGHSFG